MLQKNKDLVVFSSGYPDEFGEYLAHTFVKGYVDEAKYYYKNVFVFVLLPYIPLIFRKVKSRYPKTLKKYSYENVHVQYKTYPFIPIWPFKKFRGRIAYFFLSPTILKLIKKNSIIHANFTSPAGVFAYFLSKKIGNQYTLTVHEDHDWLVREVSEKNPDLINTWKNARTIIRVNKLDNAMLSKFNNNIITIPNGFNHRKFKPLDKKECRDELKISYKKKVIVNIGFYNDQKNQKLLIDAVKLLSDKIKENLICFIIGGGAKHEELQNYVQNQKMDSIINIVGQVSHDKLPVFLNSSDIFCLSSNSEGNPTVMFEALGTGTPYVGTNVGGVPEIIIDSKYGLLCNPGKKRELKEVLEKGLEKKWNREEIIEYSKHFSWENIFFKTNEYY